MPEALPRRFFARSAAELAPALLGCVLARRLAPRVILRGIIVETEAYTGVHDRASHASAGRRTPRNESMYARAGTAYVYFTYGMHHCFNVVCAEPETPEAVLIRALEPVLGQEHMARHRGDRPPTDLCNGPGKLCQALSIDRGLDGLDLTTSRDLWIEPGCSPAEIAQGPRIGLGNVGPWALAPLRWWTRGNRHVSRGRVSGPRKG